MKAYAVKTSKHLNLLEIETENGSQIAHFDSVSSIKTDKYCFLVYLNDGKTAKFEVPVILTLKITLQIASAMLQREIYMRTRTSYSDQFAPCDDVYISQLKEWGVRV